MATSVKISQLAEGGNIQSQDFIPIARAGETYKIAASQIVINGQNIGVGPGQLFFTKSPGAGSTLQFRSLSGSDGITVNTQGNTLVVTASGQNPVKTKFFGNGATTTFSIAGANSINSNNYRIDIDGVLQEPGEDYNINGSNIVFTSAPPLSSKVVVMSNNLVRAYDIIPSDGSVISSKLADGAVTGAAGGGKLAASAITSQTQKVTIANADELLIHSSADSALRRVAWSAMQPTGSIVRTDYVQLTGAQSYTGSNLAEASTIFTITNGHELLSRAYSCSSNTNEVILNVSAFIGASSGTRGVVAVFAGNTLIATRPTGVSYDGHTNIIIKHSPASQSSVTYSVRAACISGTLYANRMYFYDSYNTGLAVSSMLIQEIKA